VPLIGIVNERDIDGGAVMTFAAQVGPGLDVVNAFHDGPITGLEISLEYESADCSGPSLIAVPHDQPWVAPNRRWSTTGPFYAHEECQ